MVRILCVAILTCCSPALGAAATLADPPSDAAVQAAIAEYRAKLETLDASGRATASSIDRLKSEALGPLRISEMTPSQLAMVFQGRLVFVDDRREQVLTRLDEFVDDEGVHGAAAAVLRLELLGSRFSLIIKGKRWVYEPDPEQTAMFLEQALEHAALPEAVRQGDVAASLILSTIHGLRREDLWTAHRERIFHLEQLYTAGAPLQLYFDAEDYLEVLEAIAGPDERAELQRIRAGIVTRGSDMLKHRFTADASPRVFLDAERCYESLRTVADGKPFESLVEARSTIVRNGRQALKRRNDLSAQETEDLEQAFARLGGAAATRKFIGSPAPQLDFVWSSRPGLRSLDDLKGKIVVLDFWATNCIPCVASFPHIRKLQAHYEDYDVEIVGVTSIQGVPVSTKGDPEKEMSLMPAFMKQRGVTWTVAFSRQNVYNPDYGIRGIPHVVILDPAGNVRHRGLHPADPLVEKAEKINALLEEYDLRAPPLPLGHP